MRPLIGITTSVNTRDYETPDQEVVMLPHNYPEAIRRAGGTPLLITEGEVDGSLLDSLDGIIISGGRDISPALYGEEPHERTNDVRPEQDASELWSVTCRSSRSAGGTSCFAWTTAAGCTSTCRRLRASSSMAPQVASGPSTRSVSRRARGSPR